jgi:hypothetical protein
MKTNHQSSTVQTAMNTSVQVNNIFFNSGCAFTTKWTINHSTHKKIEIGTMAPSFKNEKLLALEIVSNHQNKETKRKQLALESALEMYVKARKEFVESLEMKKNVDIGIIKFKGMNLYDQFDVVIKEKKEERKLNRIFKETVSLKNLLIEDWKIVYRNPFISTTESSALKDLQNSGGVFCIGVKLLKNDKFFLCSFGDSKIFNSTVNSTNSNQLPNHLNATTPSPVSWSFNKIGFGFQETKQTSNSMCWHFSDLEDSHIANEKSIFELKKFEKIILRKISF